MEAATTDVSINDDNIILYKKRWIILGLLISLQFTAAFNLSVYNMVNNIMVVYFQKPFAIIDWLMLGNNLGTVLATPVIAWLAYNNIFSCRKVMICASVAILLSCTCSITAFAYPQLFDLLLFGQIISGVAYASAFTTPGVLAQLWFPESQIGIAISLAFFGISFEGIVSYVVLPIIFETVEVTDSSTLHDGLTNSTALMTPTATERTELWQENVKLVYEAMFSIVGLYTFGVVLLLLLWVPEQPPKPPSYAQYLKRVQIENSDQRKKSQASSKLFFTATSSLIIDKVFWANSVTSGIFLYSAYLDAALYEDISSKYNIWLTSSLSSNEKAGMIVICYCIGSAIGNFISGKVLDRFKVYQLVASIGAASSLVFAVGIVVSVNYHQGTAIAITYFAFGFSNRIATISQIDSLMQHVYPCNELFVSSWMTFVQNVVGILIVVVGRQLYSYLSAIWALSYICVLMLIALIVCVSIKPKLNRLLAEQSETSKQIEETTALLSSTHSK